jgi:hypothetical protein
VSGRAAAGCWYQCYTCKAMGALTCATSSSSCFPGVRRVLAGLWVHQHHVHRQVPYSLLALSFDRVCLISSSRLELSAAQANPFDLQLVMWLCIHLSNGIQWPGVSCCPVDT